MKNDFPIQCHNIDHYTLIVPNAKAVADVHQDVLGYKLLNTLMVNAGSAPEGKHDMLNYVMSWPNSKKGVLVVTEGLTESSIFNQFLLKFGQGIHHVAFEVEAIDKAFSVLIENGIELTSDRILRDPISGLRQFFISSKYTGVFIELIERKSETENKMAEEQGFFTQDNMSDLAKTMKSYLDKDELKETEDIFRSVTKASGVLGLKTDELTGVYLALEQMLSKGKVTTEELRRQLGERLPGAMGIMAAAIGVTIPKLDEMLKKGEVLSADALPKVAEALEIAYDIKHVETINTLVAEQNRLSKAWQLFIKNITEGDSKLRSTFGFLLKVLKESVEYIDILFESDAQSLQRAIEASTIYLKSELEQDAENDLFFRGFELREKIEKDKIALAENTKKELQSILEQELANSITQLQEHEKQKEEIIKKVAENEIDLALEEFKKQEIIYKDFLDKKLKLDESFAKERGIFNKKFTEERLKEAFGENTNLKNETDFKDLFAKIEDDLADATAKWVLFKKLIQESNVVVPDDEEVKKTQRNLRAIKDLYLEIQNEILKFGVEGNKRILDNEKSSIAERKKALLEIYQAETSIAENQNLIRIRDIESKFKREDEALKKSLENGRLSRIKYNQFILDLEKEKNQKIELVMIALSDRLLKIQDKNFKLNLEIEVDEEAIIVDKIEDDYNRRIIAIKKEFNALDTTTERKKELEVELRNLSIQMANEIIDAKIAILKSNLKLFENEEEYTEQILRDINDLEAAKKSLAEPPETARDWIAFWQEVLGFASDLLSSIGDITDGIFGNRIENIEAEIEAERNKYDTLIDLARGEELEQQQLRLEKEARIKELEKKRLKEEQKQARAKKAFAIADIGIKTAQAIIGIWADVPKVDFGISAGLLTTFVSALGAAQIGAVLATPIPKYKEGSKGIKREHIGMINDGLHKEYIERKGNILTTDRKNAIVNLLPGDVIYKSYDEMKRKSSHIDAMSNYNRNNNRQNNAFIYGIKSEIKNGFKNIKINNEIKNVIDSDNARYADSMTRWN